MPWYPAYCTKQEILDVVVLQRPDIVLDDIKDTWLKMADTNLFSYLVAQGGIFVSYDGTLIGNSPSVPDNMNLLWLATLCYTLEALTYAGLIHYTSGGLENTRIGSTMMNFSKIIPQPSRVESLPEGIHTLIPFRSFKQMAQDACNAFILYHNRNEGITPLPVNTWDMTSRGYGFNADKSLMENYDKEFDT